MAEPHAAHATQPTPGHDNVAAKLASVVTTTGAKITTQKLYEGFIEGLMEVGIRDGIPALVKYARGRSSVRPGDETQIEEVAKLYRAGQKSEAITHLRTHLEHWFSNWTFDDESIINEDSFRAVRQELLTSIERIEIMAKLQALPDTMRSRFRNVHTRQPDPDIRASNFAELKTMTVDQIRTHIRGIGLMDRQPLDAATRAARMNNRQLDHELVGLQTQFRQPVGWRNTFRNFFRLW